VQSLEASRLSAAIRLWALTFLVRETYPSSLHVRLSAPIFLACTVDIVFNSGSWPSVTRR